MSKPYRRTGMMQVHYKKGTKQNIDIWPVGVFMFFILKSLCVYLVLFLYLPVVSFSHLVYF